MLDTAAQMCSGGKGGDHTYWPSLECPLRAAIGSILNHLFALGLHGWFELLLLKLMLVML